MRLKVLLLVAGLPLLAACQTAKPPATASGRPEVTITGNVDPARVKALLLTKMIDRGFRLVKDDPFSLTMDKTSDSFGAQLLLGTPAGDPPVARVTYTIAPIGDTVRVVADMAVVQNAGMAFEKRIDVSQSGESPKVQGYLDQVAAEATAAAPKKAARR